MDVWPIHDVFLDTILMTPVIPVKTEYHLIIPVVILANEYKLGDIRVGGIRYTKPIPCCHTAHESIIQIQVRTV